MQRDTLGQYNQEMQYIEQFLEDFIKLKRL